MTALPPLAAFTAPERRVLATMLARGVNAPLTSSAGRLFDAVAAILGPLPARRLRGRGGDGGGVRRRARGPRRDRSPPPSCDETDGPLIVDWRPMLASLLAARAAGAPPGALAAGFHVAMADAIVAVARRLGAGRVLLTGGCFQNARLTGLAVARLRAAGLDPLCHRMVPPNDGGLAVGQIGLRRTPPDRGERLMCLAVPGQVLDIRATIR